LIVIKEKQHVNNITQCRKEVTWFSNYFLTIIEKIFLNLFKFDHCRTQQDFLTLTITIINTNTRVISRRGIGNALASMNWTVFLIAFRAAILESTSTFTQNIHASLLSIHLRCHQCSWKKKTIRVWQLVDKYFVLQYSTVYLFMLFPNTHEHLVYEQFKKKQKETLYNEHSFFFFSFI
jgi:hypothetical protein